MRHLCVQEPLEELEGEGAEPGAAPVDAVLEPEQPADGLAKCLPLFTAGSGHRRFIRTLKPIAGSSFKACPQVMRLLESTEALFVVRKLAMKFACTPADVVKSGFVKADMPGR